MGKVIRGAAGLVHRIDFTKVFSFSILSDGSNYDTYCGSSSFAFVSYGRIFFHATRFIGSTNPMLKSSGVSPVVYHSSKKRMKPSCSQADTISAVRLLFLSDNLPGNWPIKYKTIPHSQRQPVPGFERY